jgi:NAD(P)H-hydrate epimerase
MVLFPQQQIPQLDGRTNLIIDAIFGTGLSRPPSNKVAEVIDNINQSFAQVLAIDVPSGLDCDTGEPLGACVKATKTVTFVAEKVGFANPTSRKYTGEVVVAGIGCPRKVIDEARRIM